MKHTIPEIAAAAFAAAQGLLPGALGAFLHVTLAGTLTWAQRFLQFTVGILVSYWALVVADSLTDWSEFVLHGISFSAGLVAFESIKRLRQTAPETIGRIPGDLWNLIKEKLGGKSDGPRQ